MTSEADRLGSAIQSPPAEVLVKHLTERISEAQKRFERSIGVVALSGGVDSTTVLKLAAMALGAHNCRAIFLPDRDSDADSKGFALAGAASAGVSLETRDITEILAEIGCYDRLDKLCSSIVPSYARTSHSMRTEFVIDLADPEDLPSYDLVVLEGEREVGREPIGTWSGNQLLAATNAKQRVRMLLTYQLAEQVGGFVLNTSNKQELQQGFFVKWGDGVGDVDVLADLYKTQVRSVARELGVAEEVAARPATTDTYSAPQSQATFFFGMPERTADLTLAALELGCSTKTLAEVADVSVEYAERALSLVRRRMARADYAKANLCRD